VSDRMSYIILRGRWCHVTVLNVHAARLVCSFCIATARSLSVLSTAVSSTKFAVVGSGEAASLQCIASIVIAPGHSLWVRRH
jgi:hypothetical protein